MPIRLARRFLLITSLLALLLGIAADRRSLAAAADPAGPGGTCTTNQQCAKDELCAKLYASCDESGKCETRPTDCTERGKLLVKPVCGCDDKSYDNWCLAAAAGVNVKHEGRCAG
ncbi:MAG TPA: hypothetical protein VF173_26750 [Thermoanaerobaculia bacterium]|nr:hypothetical protein [Thermoanaerobaculia bacterium]